MYEHPWTSQPHCTHREQPGPTAEFFSSLFDSEIRRHEDAEGNTETYLHLGATWVVLPEAQVERPLLGDHIAFRFSEAELGRFAERLAALGHWYQMARNDTALYFKDFDNHLFELECVGLPFNGEI